MFANGLSAKAIATTMGISVKTVEFHKAGDHEKTRDQDRFRSDQVCIGTGTDRALTPPPTGSCGMSFEEGNSISWARRRLRWRRLKWGNESEGDGLFRQFGSGADAEFLGNSCLVKLDGFHRHVDRGSDFLIGFAFRNQLQDFPLS